MVGIELQRQCSPGKVGECRNGTGWVDRLYGCPTLPGCGLTNSATHATAAQDLLQEYVQLASMLLQATEYLLTLAKTDTKNQDQV